MAWGFSILAMTGSWHPSSVITWRTCSTSAAVRTNDRATMSTPSLSAQCRSSTSFDDMAGTLTRTPGRLIPLWSLSAPAISTQHSTSVPSTSTTRSRTLPSSRSTTSPGPTSPGNPEYVVEQMLRSPTTSRVVIVNSWPLTSGSTKPARNFPSRIFGPCRSARMPIARPLVSEASRSSR